VEHPPLVTLDERVGQLDREDVLDATFASYEFDLERLRPGLRRLDDIGWLPLAQSHEDRVQRGLHAARGAAEPEVEQLLAEELLEHAELRAIQRQRHDRVCRLAALLLHLERMAELLAHPLRLQAAGAHHDDIRFGGFDRLLNLWPQRIPAPQLARIDPHVLLELTERLLERAHDRVVVGAVRDEQLGHAYPSGVLDRHPTE
jgi:hypothetical protein